MNLQIITIDGPSGVGKGTLALSLANYLSLFFHNRVSIEPTLFIIGLF